MTTVIYLTVVLFLKRKKTMEQTEILSTEKAALIQKIHNEYKCEIIEFGLSSNNMIRITIQGTVEDIKELLNFVNRPKDENQETSNV